MINVTQFRIDKKIPIPDKDKKGMRLLESRMDVGDSVLFFNPQPAKSLSNRIFEAGFKATTRRINGGWRVWKILKQKEETL